LSPRRTFRLFPYQPERLPALLPLECSIRLQNIRTKHAIPPPGPFRQTASLEPSSWHRHSCAHRRRRYRGEVYHGRRPGLDYRVHFVESILRSKLHFIGSFPTCGVALGEAHLWGRGRSCRLESTLHYKSTDWRRLAFLPARGSRIADAESLSCREGESSGSRSRSVAT